MRTATEDMTGIGMATWHESLMPWQEPKRERPPARVPDYVRALSERLHLEAIKARNHGDAWFAIPEELRCLLIALCTERDPARGHMVKWSDLNEVEKTTIGVQARSFVRGLGKVAEVLR